MLSIVGYGSKYSELAIMLANVFNLILLDIIVNFRENLCEHHCSFATKLFL